MSLTVAIASESNEYDAPIYCHLLERLLPGVSVQVWTGAFQFNGCRAVAKLAPLFLQAARAAGVRHALLAIDNDGGLRRRREHEPSHVSPPFDPRDDDSCRECWLTGAVSMHWGPGGERLCLAVPVQTIETWLLTIRGDQMTPTPEHVHHRPTLKKRFFGPETLSARARLEKARAELAKPTALAALRSRPSFQRFEARLQGWP